MAWSFAMLQLAIAACMSLVAAQENPFATPEVPAQQNPFATKDVTTGSAKETATKDATTGSAKETDPNVASTDPTPSRELGESVPDAPGRRLGSAIENFEFAYKDTNGTDMQGGEEIDQIVFSFSFGSTTPNGDAVEIEVPSSLFTVGMQLTASPVSGGRRLNEGGVDAYGRRLSTPCNVKSSPAPTVAICSDNPSKVCLSISLERAGGVACQAGDTVAPTALTGSLPVMPAGNYPVNLQLMNSGSAVPGAVASQVVVILTANGVAISDPITFYKGKKTKFWLPLKGEHLLVQTPDLSIYASVFQGPNADLQWFDRFFIKLPDGRPVVEVGVKRDLINQNSSALRQHRIFSQLDIKVGSSNEPLQRLQRTLYSTPDGSAKVGIGTQRYDPPRLHGQPITEFVSVETASIAFVLVASHAGNEFPHDIPLQKKHAHLDWITREMVSATSFTGILPQIWGVQQPLSADVAAMLQPPSESAQICEEV